ncbi:hypothetical protein ACQ46L_004891 [Escherichia coli]
MTERVAITEGHLFRVAFAIFFQLSQAAEFQDVPLFPGVFFLPGCIDSLEVRKKPGGHWIIRDLAGLDLVGLASL